MHYGLRSVAEKAVQNISCCDAWGSLSLQEFHVNGQRFSETIFSCDAVGSGQYRDDLLFGFTLRLQVVGVCHDFIFDDIDDVKCCEHWRVLGCEAAFRQNTVDVQCLR